MVILSASANAQEAALAMRTNGIAAILVADDAGIVGIVTDRDLALRVVAANRNPRGTRLKEIMSKDLVTLALEDAQSEALAVMRDRQIRRIALIERGRAVGMVTLDDLILEKAATLEELAEVVGAQIIVIGPAQTRPFDESRSIERRYARGLNTWIRFAVRVQAGAHLDKREHAERAAEIVLAAMVRSLAPTSGKKLIARLPPAMLRARLLDLPAGPDASVTLLARSVPASDAVGRRLPDDLRSVLRPRRAAARVGARSVASSKRARPRA